MGGMGSRFGSSIPKQFHRLAGKKVYLYALETFLSSQLFKEIILVCAENWIHEVQSELAEYPFVRIVAGGASRQESSFKGLLACDPQTEIVVIHDAVRPFVSQEILKQNICCAEEFGAVDTCITSTDTLVHAPTKRIESIPNRGEYFRGQTPQSFAYPLILQAHRLAWQEGIQNSTDDCSLVLRQKHPVHVVMGSEENIKITSELDLFLAEQILRLKKIPSPASDSSLKGKRIAVTGGTGGIGQALCEQLLKEGAIPLVISRTAPIYAANLSCYAQAHQIFNQILTDHGFLDGLVNCIGFLQLKELKNLSPQEIDQQIGANLTGVIYSCQCAHLKKGAHIINISSSSYSKGRKNFAIYASTKAAVVNFTQGLAEERGDLCINTVIPQRTHTPMRRLNFPDEELDILLDPTEVAKEVIHILKQNSFTGNLIEVRKHLGKRFTQIC